MKKEDAILIYTPLTATGLIMFSSKFKIRQLNRNGNTNISCAKG